jgi:hypothetical protein
MNSVRTLTPYIKSIVICLFQVNFPLGCPTKIVFAFLTAGVRATSRDHFTHLDFMTLTLGLADPLAGRSEVRALIARTLDRGFESRLRYGCLSSSSYVVLSCVGRG